MKKYIKISNIIIVVILCQLFSCKKYFEVSLDENRIVDDRVFESDKSATSALIGLYQSVAASSFIAGGNFGIPLLTGLSSDEFANVLRTEMYVKFENNNLIADNPEVLTLWKEAYHIIYQANDLIEEANATNGLSETIRNQIIGESLFIRGLAHFNLVNLFADVPLILTTNYAENTLASRMPTELVLNQVIIDLNKAESLLRDNYSSDRRIRPNRKSVLALLARIHLYRKNWEEAANFASSIIDDDNYELVEDLNAVFLTGSNEVIWRIASEAGVNTKEGETFIVGDAPGSGSVDIRPELLNIFEAQDKRRSFWIGAFEDPASGREILYPAKYKARYFDPPTEDFVVFRLAEQFLIRAEAKAILGQKESAIQDIDEIRNRAGLPPISELYNNVDDATLADIIFKERQVELLAEGHRWFDLKRSNRIAQVLGSLKETWTDTDQLYPIPQDELDKNPKLGDQNLGY